LNISRKPILTLPNLQKPFNVEPNASGYTMGVVLMRRGKLVCYHSEMFHGGVLNYLTYDKELYALVQSIKKWKHYLMGKETIRVSFNKPYITSGWGFVVVSISHQI
jgi:hypothetical protein